MGLTWKSVSKTEAAVSETKVTGPDAEHTMSDIKATGQIEEFSVWNGNQCLTENFSSDVSYLGWVGGGVGGGLERDEKKKSN